MTGVTTPTSTPFVWLNALWKNGRIISGAVKLVSDGLDKNAGSLRRSFVPNAAGDLTVMTTAPDEVIAGGDSTRLSASSSLVEGTAGGVAGTIAESASVL